MCIAPPHRAETATLVAEYLDSVRGVIGDCAQAVHAHEAFIARHCATGALAAA